MREETGLEVRIVRPFDSIEYWFVQGGTRIHKTVHYFLMEPDRRRPGRHDHEFDEVRWVGFDEAPALLTLRDRARARRPRGASAATDGAFPPRRDGEGSAA